VRVVGLDLGSRRIGVAASDTGGRLALPHGVLERAGRPEEDRDRLVRLVAELGAQLVVVGLPVSLDGSEGPAARQARAEAQALAERLGVPVVTHDERLTTAEAQRRLGEAGAGLRSRRRSADRVAAAIMLQSYLDSRRGA
jgi:putative Holliday junction resolvase